MLDETKTREQLLAEITALQQRLATLEEHPAAAALRQSEKRYRHLVESSQGLICTHDLDGVLLSINPAAAHILGSPAEAIVGKSLRTFLTPSTRHLFDTYLQQIRQHGSDRGLMCVVTNVGEERILAYHNVRLQEPGDAPYVLGHAQDITDRIRITRELRDSEARLRIFTEQLPIILWTVDVDLRFTSSLGAGLASLQQRPGEAVGLTLFDYFQTDDASFIPIDVHRQALQGSSVEYEFSWQGNTYRAYVEPLHDTTSDIIGCIGLALDITESKRLEQQLHLSQKMEAIGTLAGGIAHDFNNILAAIIGYAELAAHSLDSSSPPWRHLREVLQAGQRGKDLVQQILTFSRRDDRERQPLQLDQLVADALPFLRASLPTTIDIQPQLQANSGTVLANASQLQQVLMDLCANAEYTMRATGGVLNLRVESIDVDATLARQHPPLRPGPYVRLIIQDSGYGMDSTALERIFEPFYTTKSTGEGTGLGLAVVHGIVASHEGAITVQSALNVGTMFAIYLPCVTSATESSGSAEIPIPHGHGRILFVDDEAPLAQLAQDMLEHLGYEVEIYTGSLEALAVFRATPSRFDLVITDQTMPNMTGEKLARELRRIRPDIPIILCTGFSHVMHADKARDLGIDAFCMKPLTTRELATTVQQVLP